MNSILNNLFLAHISNDNLVLGTLLKTVTKQGNFLSRYIADIDWDSIISHLVELAFSLIFFSFLFIVINWIGKKIIRRTFAQYRMSSKYSTNRVETINSLTLNLFHYVMLFFYLYAILSVLGVPVGTLIAGAGILSVALGLGAQGFVTDVVTGFFILLEQQFDVGDIVRINTIEGPIVAVGLRTTQIEDYDGILHFVPNRNITIVSNLSRNNMRAVIDIRIDVTDDVDKITEIVQKVNDQLVPLHPEIKDGPNILGLVDLGKGSLVFRVVVFTLNGEQAPIQRTFLAGYLTALNEAHIHVLNSPITLN